MPISRYDIPLADYADEKNDARPSASQDNYTSASPAKEQSEPFTGSNLDDVTKYLTRQLSEYRQLEETDEDRKKRERREGRQRRLAAIGDILGSMHRAYSHARGVEPIKAENVSDKVQARIDRARAERDRISDRVISISAALDRLNRSREEADYRKKSLAIRQQQQDRLAKIAEADVDLKLSRIDKFNSDKEIREAESAVKIRLMEAGINEKEANARAKEIVANSTAAKNYALAEKAKRDKGSSSTHAGEVKIIETTDKNGNKSVSRTHYEPEPKPQEQKKEQKKEEKAPASPKQSTKPNSSSKKQKTTSTGKTKIDW